MSTHNAPIYHCRLCGRVVHAEAEAAAPQCCGRAMARACSESVEEAHVDADRANDHSNTPPLPPRAEHMGDHVDTFFRNVHDKLETLEGRMDSLKRNVGTTWHSLQVKLDEVRHKRENIKQDVWQGRAALEQWARDQAAEAKGTIDNWVETREHQKLAARAQRAEDCAWIAIAIAEASVDDAERMILEAIPAWRDAEAVTVE